MLRTGGTTNFYLERMVEGIDQRDRPTSFALELAAKDMGLVVDTGRSLAVPTPQGSALLQVLVGAMAEGLGDHDWSDLVTAAERQGNVELKWNRLTHEPASTNASIDPVS